MTATNSSKKSFFWNRYLNNIRQNQKNVIVNIILNIFGLPAMTIATLVMFYADEKDTFDIVEPGCYTFIVIGFICIGVSILLGSTIALSQYKYLYKKTITDMNYSLPLSSTQRFFADYLSGLTVYIVPPVVSILVSIIMVCSGKLFINIDEMWESESMPLILEIALIIIIAMIQYYAISVFALTFCGNGFEAHFSIIAFVVMIPATIGCLWIAIVETSSFGIAEEAIFTKSIFTCTNPAGAVAFLIGYINSLDSYFETFSESLHKSTYMLLEWIFTMFVSIAFYVCSAWLLHKYRKAEDVSKPYVHRSFFYALMTMGVFCILSLFLIFDGFVIAGIVICAVIWFIMEIITRRGFKKFWTAAVGFVAAVASVFIICGICDATDGFGASRYVPSYLGTDSVRIYISGFSNIKYRDKDVIKAAIDLQKDIIDRRFNPQNYTYNEFEAHQSRYYYTSNVDTILDLTYSTMTGSTTKREYQVNSSMIGDLVKAMILSDEYADYVSTQLGSRLYTEDEKFGIKYNLNLCDRLKNSINQPTLTERQMEEIRNAYKEDMKNMTEDELINGKVFCYIDKYWVLESFENTKKALDTKIPEITAESFRYNYVDIITEPKFFSNFKAYIESEKGRYYSYNYDEKNVIVLDKITTIYPKSNTDIEGKEVSIDIKKDGVLELIRNSTPIIIGEMPLAVITLDNNVELYIRNTPENVKIMESIDFKDASKKKNDKYYYDEYGWDDEVYY